MELDDAATREVEEQVQRVVELARQDTEEQENEETRCQMQGQHPEDFEFHGEEDNYEEDSEFKFE